MRILVSGSSGLVGSALIAHLGGDVSPARAERASFALPGRRDRAEVSCAAPSSSLPGPHEIVRLVRRPQRSDRTEIAWDPSATQLDARPFAGFDVVVHLAGESIAQGRWTEAKKARIRNSRVQGTRLLCEALARSGRPPKVLISASAVGYYGDRGEEELDEASGPGTGFLAELCGDWEAATEPVAATGVRVVLARFGVILAPHGGALPRLLRLFRFGLGGRLGSGRQYFSWIMLGDAVRAICFAIENDLLQGPVNLVAPNPVTNRELTAALGRALRRPTLLPVPAWALRLALGEMADAMLLASTRVVPRQLQKHGYQFAYPTVQDALKAIVRAEPPRQSTGSGNASGSQGLPAQG